MEVQKEAQRIMTMSVWKMYHSRMQRGGLRLHRSLQLSLVMRNARDLYLSAKLDEEDEAAAGGGPGEALAQPEGPPSPASLGAQTPPPASPQPEPMETQEEPAPPRTRWSRRAPGPPPGAAKPSRKRRSSSLGKLGAAEAGLVPSKKAKLADEEEGERQPQRQEGPFPSLARVLQDRFSGLVLPPQPPPPPPKGSEEPRACRRQGDGVLSIMLRAVVAF